MITNLKTLLFIISFLTGFSSFAYAQEQLSKEMKAYYDYCLDVRNSVKEQNLENLKKCIQGWDTENNITYKDMDITLARFDTTDVNIIDGSGQIDISGHLQFAPNAVDSLILYAERLKNFPDIASWMPDYTLVPELTRGSYNCKYGEYAISAGKQMSLDLNHQCAECEIFVISETGEKLDVKIDSSDKKTHKEGLSGEIFFNWKMECAGYNLIIKNPNKKDLSVIVVVN